MFQIFYEDMMHTSIQTNYVEYQRLSAVRNNNYYIFKEQLKTFFVSVYHFTERQFAPVGYYILNMKIPTDVTLQNC